MRQHPKEPFSEAASVLIRTWDYTNIFSSELKAIALKSKKIGARSEKNAFSVTSLLVGFDDFTLDEANRIIKKVGSIRQHLVLPPNPFLFPPDVPLSPPP